MNEVRGEFNDGKLTKFIEFDLASTTSHGIEQYNTPFVVIRTLSDKADGLAHETYENMADLAADNSCRIVMEMLKASKAIENND